jgi:hypothetical protein
MGEMLRTPKRLVMNSRLSKRMFLLREKPPHDMRSLSAATSSADDRTIETSRGKARYKSPFLACQLSVFFISKNRVVKNVHSSFEMVLRTTNHTMIYPGSFPSSKVIVIHPAV